MGKKIKNSTFLGRGIHKPNFLKSLINGNLKQMLNVINSDIDLDVQIRNDYLNIYYNGGNIAEVHSDKSVVFDEFYFYLDIKINPTKLIKEDKEVVKKLRSERDSLTNKFKESDFKGYFSDAKIVMDKWLKANPKPERMEQHKLSIENQYNKSDYTIIDLEYQVSTKSDFVCTYTPNGKDKPKEPRFDIIAINNQGNLCVIELKKGTKALYGRSGLKEHFVCYQKSIGMKHEPFMIEMENLLEQKQAFNLIDKQLKIKSPIPEFMFAYSYDDKTTIENQDKAFHIECDNVGVPVHVLKLAKGTSKLLDL